MPKISELHNMTVGERIRVVKVSTWTRAHLVGQSGLVVGFRHSTAQLLVKWDADGKRGWLYDDDEVLIL